MVRFHTGSPIRFVLLAGVCFWTNVAVESNASAVHRGIEHEGFGQGPEMWIHGLGGSPETAARIQARGVRQIINLRGAGSGDVGRFLERFAGLDVGLCLTLRWAESAGEEGRSRMDKPPTAEESRAAMDAVILALNSDAARRLNGRLWVQFFNEYLGGPGSFESSDDDRMFQWATEAAGRLRSEAPHVRLTGPAMTATEVLDESESSLSPARAERRRRLARGIRWSIQHTDAVDVHLHTDGRASADARLASVRRFMNDESGGEQCGLVVWEWSCARRTDRSDLKAAEQATRDVYAAMSQHGVIAAAYSQYHVPKRISEQFGWVTLTDDRGRPRQPFYSLFIELAAGGAMQESATRSPSQSAPSQERARRIKRRSK